MYKKHFPIFESQPDLVYLDSAATALKPEAVVDAARDYYLNYSANVHRGLYPMAERASLEYEAARQKVADFMNAKKNEVIFNLNATAALNMLAYGLDARFEPQSQVLVLLSEHHSNLVVWQEFCKRNNLKLKVAANEQELLAGISKQTCLLAASLMSNVTGLNLDSHLIMQRARQYNVLTVLDACQFIVHNVLDVQALDCDFLVFSAHKLYGPSGVGVLYGREAELARLKPAVFGGNMVEEVSAQVSTYKPAPEGFEAGTPNIAGVIALGALIDFLQAQDLKKIYEYEHSLAEYLFSKLRTYPDLQVLGGLEQARSLVAFNLPGIHPHDLAYGLAQQNICVRAGQHCAMPLHESLGVMASLRVSLGMYNTKQDIDKFLACLQDLQNYFKKTE